jgi:hypothetical protein
MMDRSMLESAIADLVTEYEAIHTCEVSSVWVEHCVSPHAVEVTVTVREPVRVQ